MYVNRNFRTKKQLRQAIRAGERVYVQPTIFGGPQGPDIVIISGPWAPEPHKWYARCMIDADNRIVTVR